MSRDPAAWRSSLEARLRNTSERTGVDVGRLRRHLVFQRMLARLAGDERWVLKGGFALEVRFSLASRATKDLDLVVLGEIEGTQLQDLLDEALDRDVDNDQFTFLVSTPKPISSDEAGNPGWRLTVVAKLAGRDFAHVAVDVVARSGGDRGCRVDAHCRAAHCGCRSRSGPDARSGSGPASGGEVPRPGPALRRRSPEQPGQGSGGSGAARRVRSGCRPAARDSAGACLCRPRWLAATEDALLTHLQPGS